MKSIWLVVSFLVLLLSGCKKNQSLLQRSASTNIHDTLQTIPFKDQEILDSFFQLLLRDYNFSYTLFGTKPLSMACYSSEITPWTLYHPSEFLIFEKGWDVWEKYSSLFPSNELVLKRFKDKRNVFEIFLINKKNVLKTISDNLIVFQAVLDRDINPEKLLQQICHSQDDIMKILNNNSGLLGILLGYGKSNAMTFERKVNICHTLNANMYPPFSAHNEIKSLLPISQTLVNLYGKGSTPVDPSKICLPLQCTSLGEELNHILASQKIFEIYGSDFFLDKMISPVFMIHREDSETQLLHEEYKNIKEQLYQSYLQGSFLEVTLNQWINFQ